MLQRLTRQELQSENEMLRTKLEMAQRIISDALGYEDEDSDLEDDDEEEEEVDDQ